MQQINDQQLGVPIIHSCVTNRPQTGLSQVVLLKIIREGRSSESPLPYMVGAWDGSKQMVPRASLFQFGLFMRSLQDGDFKTARFFIWRLVALKQMFLESMRKFTTFYVLAWQIQWLCHSVSPSMSHKGVSRPRRRHKHKLHLFFIIIDKE